MEQQTVINLTEEMVRKKLLGEGSGHDWYHIERVTTKAKQLAEKEKADLFIVTLAALLHDLADDKVVESEEQGIIVIREWLDQHGVAQHDTEHILSIIQHISFKGVMVIHLKQSKDKLFRMQTGWMRLGLLGSHDVLSMLVKKDS